jgi:sugar O-acyltransferase (sialic acid O-acetyltransferase NeuD family)
MTDATRTLLGIYGVGGFGREVMAVARTTLATRPAVGAVELVFVDDEPGPDSRNGHRVLRYEEFLSVPASTRYVCTAISHSRTRERISERCARDGVLPFSVVAENAIVLDGVTIGDGAIVQPFVTIGANAVVGRSLHANVYTYVAHDCVIGDFVTFAPGALCSGNVHVGDHAYVGAGAVIKQGKPGAPLVIGAGAILGMGAVVTRSVPAGVTVVGNPARLVVRS